MSGLAIEFKMVHKVSPGSAFCLIAIESFSSWRSQTLPVLGSISIKILGITHKIGPTESNKEILDKQYSPL